ncbi:IS66 family insertion sequence element accessory protein TnpA [Thauera aromatica]|uniref:IS66 family insertion sequence element accessory protein TnpA n=1 Tax=Thauera aromatica TaxID=59405 RepID=UPI001FFC67DB|nr:hypothetical protein [Thauera aromatica]MCK2096584.1 hypothetical protein [Thauera aromatica]
MSTQSERAACWREHVERWRRSGQTQAAYSAEHGVSKKSLGYWVRQARQEAARKPDSSLTLVAARAVGITPPRQAAEVLLLRSPSGWSLQFGALPPASWLAEVLAHGAA